MKKRTLHFLIVDAALAACALACLAVCLILAAKPVSQKAARRWAGEGDIAFAQLSCFLGMDDALTPGDLYAFRTALANKLTEASMEAPEGGSLFRDAWSAFGTLKVAGEHGSADAAVTAVGGDFFFFHPLRLVSGSYITEDDVMDDRVVLDRELAWRLFGGDDLVGMTVTVGETPFVVTGVVEREQDFASRKAQSESPGMYLSFRAWDALTEEAQHVDCYELVMPQPVDGFAENLVKENLKLGGGELVNNTERFDLSGIFTVIREFGTRSMHTNSVIYPYWENAARFLGGWCALFLALAAVFAVLPAATALVGLMLLLVRGRNYLAGKAPKLVAEAVDRPRRKRWERYHGFHEK